MANQLGRSLGSLLTALCCLAGVLGAGSPSPASAEPIRRLIVDIRTADERFAGTDDPVMLSIGGYSFPLDNPSRDDFERNRTDRFDLTLPGAGLDIEVGLLP